jgi:hypothetical protein
MIILYYLINTNGKPFAQENMEAHSKTCFQQGQEETQCRATLFLAPFNQLAMRRLT